MKIIRPVQYRSAMSFSASTPAPSPSDPAAAPRGKRRSAPRGKRRSGKNWAVAALVGCVAASLAGCGTGGRTLGTAGPTAQSEGVTLRTLPLAGRVVFAPDSRTVAVNAELGAVRLWDIDSATLLRTLHYTPHHSIES